MGTSGSNTKALNYPRHNCAPNSAGIKEDGPGKRSSSAILRHRAVNSITVVPSETNQNYQQKL